MVKVKKTGENLLVTTNHHEKIHCQEVLDSYLLGNLADSEKEFLEMHLMECEFCLDEYEERLQKMSHELEVKIKYQKICSLLNSVDEEKREVILVNAVGSRKPKTVRSKTK